MVSILSTLDLPSQGLVSMWVCRVPTQLGIPLYRHSHAHAGMLEFDEWFP